MGIRFRSGIAGLVVLVVLGASLAGPAGATPTTPDAAYGAPSAGGQLHKSILPGIKSELHRATRESLPLEALARRLAKQILVASGIPAGLFDARKRTGFQLFPAGDIDDDGSRDVFGVRTERSDADVFTTVIAALSGADGSTIWTHEEIGAYSFPLSARVGPEGEAGALVLSYQGLARAPVGYTYEYRFTLSALSAEGDLLWTRSFVEVIAFFYPTVRGVVARLSYVSGLLNAVEGRATDLMIEHYDLAYVENQFVVRTELEIVDGRDGTTTNTMSPGLSGAYSWPVTDLSGDGLDDYIWFSRRAEDEPITMSARRGYDSSEIWARKRPFPFYQGTSIADATGDDVEDLLVFNSCAECLSWSARHSDRHLRRVRPGRMALLDGSTGKLEWEKRASFPVHVGDLDADGREDVGAQTLMREQSDLNVVYQAFSSTGSVLHSSEYSVPFGRRVTIDDFAVVPSIGDVNGDGASDSSHSFSFADFETEQFVTERAIVSGADGSALAVHKAPGQALHAPLEGSGDDFIKRSFESGGNLVLTAMTGDGSEIWKRAITLNDKARAQVIPASIDSDDQTEIIVNTTIRTRGKIAYRGFVLDNDGSILWSID